MWFSAFTHLTFGILIVTSEWEIPEEFRPPRVLIDIVGGFSPFVRYVMVASDSIQNWLQIYAEDHSHTRFSYISSSISTKFFNSIRYESTRFF